MSKPPLRKLSPEEFIRFIPLLEEVLKQFTTATDIKIVPDFDLSTLDAEADENEGVHNKAS